MNMFLNNSETDNYFSDPYKKNMKQPFLKMNAHKVLGQQRIKVMISYSCTYFLPVNIFLMKLQLT